MNEELKGILTDILDLIERLARGYSEDDIIYDIKNIYKRINNLEENSDEFIK